MQEEKENILINEDASFNVGKLKDAKIVSYILHGIALALLLFLLVWRDDYQIAWSLCILFPLLPYLVYRKYKGFINIVPTRDKSNPSIGFAMLIPPFAMALAVMDYQYLNDHVLYLYSGMFAVLMFLLFLDYIINNYKKGTIPILFDIVYLLVIGGLYGYGLSTHINSDFDRSNEQNYKVQVLNKFQQHRFFGKSSTTYNYVVLAPWGPVSQNTAISVDYRTYVALGIGNIAVVKLKSGAIGIPWYTIKTNATWEESVSKL